MYMYYMHVHGYVHCMYMNVHGYVHCVQNNTDIMTPLLKFTADFYGNVGLSLSLILVM